MRCMYIESDSIVGIDFVSWYSVLLLSIFFVQAWGSFGGFFFFGDFFCLVGLFFVGVLTFCFFFVFGVVFEVVLFGI